MVWTGLYTVIRMFLTSLLTTERGDEGLTVVCETHTQFLEFPEGYPGAVAPGRTLGGELFSCSV